ncbi:MAG: ATP-binding protein, partial [Lachnospiraceae bacterium]|nr:ATP-binding protein [Lachnospiraceae bacterium]
MLKEAGKRKKRVLIAIDEVSNTKNMKAFAHSYQAFIGEGLTVFLLMTALPENFSALSNSKNGTFLKRLPRIKLGGLSDILVVEKYKEIFDIPDET